MACSGSGIPGRCSAKDYNSIAVSAHEARKPRWCFRFLLVCLFVVFFFVEGCPRVFVVANSIWLPMFNWVSSWGDV